MSKRRADSLTERSAALYDEAFKAQAGEYYPQHHEANIRGLYERYPAYSAEEIDSIYRQACCIEYEIEQWTGGLKLSEGSREELMEWLDDHFFGFSRETFAWALERVEQKQA